MTCCKFLAYQGTDWLAKIIRWETQSVYSHIAYIYDDEHTIECWPEKWTQLLNVRWTLRPIFKGYKKGDRYEIWSLPVSSGQKVFIDNFFLTLVKKKAKFDYISGTGLFVKWRRERPGEYFCSEGCIAPLVKTFQWTSVQPWKVTPENFIWLIQVAGGKLVEEGVVP